MFKSKKMSAVAAVLGGVVLLLGVGGGRSVATESPSTCSDDGQGNVLCRDTGEREFTSKTYGKVRMVNDVRQSCSGERADVSCGTSLSVDGQEL